MRVILSLMILLTVTINDCRAEGVIWTIPRERHCVVCNPDYGDIQECQIEIAALRKRLAELESKLEHIPYMSPLDPYQSFSVNQITPSCLYGTGNALEIRK